ncbi:hypothetical protein F5Y03DRAFT_250539 [Xylaria venustula]|nr:hypothetical protein F5Y03DRAFT_250539 [Xylaria venustula]
MHSCLCCSGFLRAVQTTLSTLELLFLALLWRASGHMFDLLTGVYDDLQQLFLQSPGRFRTTEACAGFEHSAVHGHKGAGVCRRYAFSLMLSD